MILSILHHTFWWQLPLIPEPQANYKVFEGRDLKKKNTSTTVFVVILYLKQLIIIIIIAELYSVYFAPGTGLTT